MDPDYRRKKNFFEFFFKVFSELYTRVLNEKNSKKKRYFNKFRLPDCFFAYEMLFSYVFKGNGATKQNKIFFRKINGLPPFELF